MPVDPLNPQRIKQALTDFKLDSAEKFAQGYDIEQLLHQRADFIDQLLQQIWLSLQFNANISLLAVGGYGRRELHPFSDIDLLLLSHQEPDDAEQQKIARFLALLWDIKLEIGHSVRTLSGCIDEAKNDISVMTNLLESRLIIGQESVVEQLRQALYKPDIWPIRDFFHAKLAEQQQRHQRYNSTSYNLEPDIKNGPGGLRDIHILQWITLRYFSALSFEQIITHDFITEAELNELENCRYFLWRVRFALHLEVSRPDNRLLFDRQINVAHRLGYQGDGNQAVETMMKDFYRVVQTVHELNSMLLRLFEQQFLQHDKAPLTSILDDEFAIKDQQIDVRQPQLFIQQPVKIIQLFYLMACHPEINDITPHTLRLLRQARLKLRFSLSEIPAARQLFMAILRHPHGVRGALLPMHQHGVLTIYIPQWEQITGLMQFDLFHAYTVDEHTIRVLLNIDGFANPENRHNHPLCVDIYPALSKPEVLLLAALFHDIAKGRGGDHSLLGGQDIEQFARLHELREKDVQRAVWLVENHLLMSKTAQQQDIYDPAVIKHFATQVDTLTRLQYLLCLTVADICATNPNLWNGWKQSLLKELYLATEQQLDRGLDDVPDQRNIARQNRQEALALLKINNIDESMIQPIWQQCRVDYFIRHSADQLAWHGINLVQHDLDSPLVLINPQAYHGGTEIFIYAPDRPFLFATVSGALDARNLNIHAAQIFTNKQGMAMDTFIVLEPDGRIVASDRYPAIEQALINALNQTKYIPPKKRRRVDKTKPFVVATRIEFITTAVDKKTYMQLTALDRPGLLARIGEVFANLNLSLHNARISTIGERVEDLFVLTDSQGNALDENIRKLLHIQLVEAIDSMDNSSARK